MKCLNVKHTDVKRRHEKSPWKERDFSKCQYILYEARVGDEIAPQYSHRYGSYCGIIQFQPENDLPGPCHRLSGTHVAGIGWKTTVERSYCPHLNLCAKRKVRGRSEGSVLHAKNCLAKGTNIMYANTMKGVLEYHLMYFLYNNKNQWLVKYSLRDGRLE